MKTTDLVVEGQIVQGFEIPLQNANLIVIVAKKGYLMCGYLNMEGAEKFGDCAAVVRGVKNVQEMLDKSVSAVTKKASELGVEVGMTGCQAISKML